MPRTIRFHLDEHCPTALAEGLRRRGIDVTTTVEANLLQASDEEHLAFALGEQRVIFTQDVDFLRLHAAGLKHAGITYCHPESRSLGDILRMLILLGKSLNEKRCSIESSSCDRSAGLEDSAARLGVGKTRATA